MEEAAKKDQKSLQKDLKNIKEKVEQASAVIQSLNAALPTHSNLHQNPEFCKALTSVLQETSMDNLRTNAATLSNKLAVSPDLCHHESLSM
jgi:hypothetical protein